MTSREIELSIRGMHCGGCVAGVERALNGVEGVRSASASLVAHRARVECDADTPEFVERLVAAVRAAGFEAEPSGPVHALSPDSLASDAMPAGAAVRAAAERRRVWTRIAIGGVLSIPVIVGHFAEHALAHALHGSVDAMRFAAGVLTVAVCIVPGAGMFAEAWRAVRVGRTNMDVLVALGAGVALLAGWFGWWLDRHELVMHHATVMIVMFIAVGRALETVARGRAAEALETLFSRLPERALQLVDDAPVEVAAARLRPGDVVRLVADANVPLDAEIRSGRISVDESMLTGESLPIERSAGQHVLGGTRIVDGQADAVITADGASSAAAQIARLIERAQATKTPWQRVADQAAGVFVPIVIALSLLTLGGWVAAGATWIDSIERAIAVLVVACPCALGLATPVAALVGGGRAAQLGVLFRESAALERAGRITDLLLDKTGTLTRGEPELAAIHLVAEHDRPAVLAMAAAVARHSQHPYSRAIALAADQEGAAARLVTDFRARAGLGLQANISGRRVLLGSGSWMRENGVSLPIDAPGEIGVWMALDDALAAGFRFRDTLHPDAPETIRALLALGVRPRILSGDRESVVREIAAELGIDVWRAALQPQDKLDELERARAAGRVIGFVGDGVNDAPALRAADVGVAIGTGTDVARAAADVCLVGGSPLGVVRAIRASRATRRVMLENLGWAVGYNALMLPAVVFFPVPPAVAAAAMMLSSLSVVLNALRLRRIIR